MNTVIENLLKQYAQDLEQSKQLIAYALQNKDSFLIQSVTLVDSDLRWAVEQGKESSLVRNITNGIRHAAWKAYFNEISLSKQLTTDKYWKAIKEYGFDNAEKRRLINGVTEIKDFTLENIEEFNNKFLTISEAEQVKALNDILYRTGKDYRSHNSEFKTRQTFVGKVSGGEKPCVDWNFADELANALSAINYFRGIQMDADYIGQMRNTLKERKEWNEEVVITEGISYVLKTSLSVELRIDKSILPLINSKVTINA